jgi:hypothetical protein
MLQAWLRDEIVPHAPGAGAGAGGAVGGGGEDSGAALT